MHGSNKFCSKFGIRPRSVPRPIKKTVSAFSNDVFPLPRTCACNKLAGISFSYIVALNMASMSYLWPLVLISASGNFFNFIKIIYNKTEMRTTLLMMAVLPLLVDQIAAKNTRSRSRGRKQKIEQQNKSRFVALFEQAKFAKECAGITSEELIH